MNAVELLTELSMLGVVLEAKGERLKVDAPKGAVTVELREALMAHKAEVLVLLRSFEYEISWRVQAMLPQIPDIGLIPFLFMRELAKPHTNCCLSCGEPLRDALYRCLLCDRAANLALELSMRRTKAIIKDANYVS